MINFEKVAQQLYTKFPNLEPVHERVFRSVDTFDGRPYAIRYFDLTDDIIASAAQLRAYQDKLLGGSYFDAASRPDLRWNHYLYFVTSAKNDDEYVRAKASVEADREYARKRVVSEDELQSYLFDAPFEHLEAGLPPDPLSIWSRLLEEHKLGFVIDETLQAPSVVRYIADGTPQPAVRRPNAPDLDAAERAVSSDFIRDLAISEFRRFPVKRQFQFGTVNLIVGVNGVGKTSLLEAIEYLFCGKTRRSTTLPQKTRVSASLATSGLSLETRPSTSAPKLRARHLVWYGKTELRTLTLHDSFSKFNFLDTDAAARLSVEKSRERVFDDLVQLLLGAEASKALDRLERVTKQLADTAKSIDNDIAFRDYVVAEGEQKIKALESAPRESDEIFAQFVRVLAEAGWRRVPPAKVSLDGVTADIQAAKISVGVLLESPGGEFDSKVSSKIDELRRAKEAAEALDKQLAQARIQRSHNQSRLALLEKRLNALSALMPFVSAQVGTLGLKRETVERQLGLLTASMAVVEPAANRIRSAGPKRGLLSTAIQENARRVADHESRLAKARGQLKDLESTQTLLNSQRQRLRFTAQELLNHVGEKDQCPLCGAAYEQGELNRRIESTLTTLVDGESERLRTEVSTVQAEAEIARAMLLDLSTLADYVPDTGGLTVSAALAAVARDSETLSATQRELGEVRRAIEANEGNGWSAIRLKELCSEAGVDQTVSSSAEVDALLIDARDAARVAQDALAMSEREVASLEERGAEFSVGPGYEEVLGTASHRPRTIGELLARYELAARHVDDLRKLIDWLEPPSLRQLEVTLRQAQESLVSLKTVLARERADGEALARERKGVQEARDESAGLRVRIQRVRRAENVLSDILGSQSEAFLTQRVLSENANRIAKIFARIHAPNEFDVVVEGGFKIVRRGAGEVDLDQMSSGQRAAYALSLFFAMNERLQAGPRVIMLDDPVAHVDDINTLSLIDHLRDLALTGERQIFFATADVKLAALFERKFRFLGEQFRQVALDRSRID